MSSIERNKGTLYPVELSEVLNKYPDADINDLEWCTGGEYVNISSNIFKVKWVVRYAEDDIYFADVGINPDGSIDFHIVNYNGGSNWTEFVEDVL